MPPLDLTALAPGDRVQHEFRVAKRRNGTTRDGAPFVRLVLGNATGEIETAPIWADKVQDGWADGAEAGVIVQAIGHVEHYEGRRQLRLSSPLRVVPSETACIEDFLPVIAESPAKLWAGLDALRNEIASERLREALALFYCDDDFRLRLERAPASVNGHHARVGGLLLHVWEVTYIARHIARATHADTGLVIAGAMLHDIGKVESYDVSLRGFDHTTCGHLLGHVVLGCLMLERRLAALGHELCTEDQVLELQHLILSHHGELEYGSPVRPLTLEAEIVHWADQASSKAHDVADSLADPDAFRDGQPFGDRSQLWRAGKRSLWRRPHEWT